MRKNLTQNLSIALVFWDTPKYAEKIKNAKAPTNNKQLESFVALDNYYGRMIPDFTTTMLPLNNMRNSNFSWRRMQQKAFEEIKN